MKWQRIAIATVMAVVVLATAIGFSRRTQAQTTNQLAGTYRLISQQRTVVATGETTEPMGKAPKGYISFGRDGRMMVLLVGDNRPTPKDLETMTDQERADLFRTMLALSGTYDLDGATVTYHPDVTWNGFGRVRTKKDLLSLTGEDSF